MLRAEEEIKHNKQLTLQTDMKGTNDTGVIYKRADTLEPDKMT